MEPERDLRRRDSDIFLFTVDYQMALNLSPLRSGHHLPPERFLVRTSLRGCVDPGDIVLLKGLGNLKYGLI
jgi:hypothetical protein